MWRFLQAFLLASAMLGCTSQEPVEQSAPPTQVSLHVEGMMCEGSCAKTVQQILASRPGVQDAVVHFEEKEAICVVDPAEFDVDAAVAELADQDFTASVHE